MHDEFITFAQKARLQKELSDNGLGEYYNDPKLDTMSKHRASEYINVFDTIWGTKDENLKQLVIFKFKKEIKKGWDK